MRESASVPFFADCFPSPVSVSAERGHDVLMEPGKLFFVVEEVPAFPQELFGLVVTVELGVGPVAVGDPLFGVYEPEPLLDRLDQHAVLFFRFSERFLRSLALG